MKINVKCEGGSPNCEGRYWGQWFSFINEEGFVLPSECPSCAEARDKMMREHAVVQAIAARNESEIQKDRLRVAHYEEPFIGVEDGF